MAYRIYERGEYGGKKLLSVVFLFGLTSDEASFRFAGSEKTETVPRKTWDGWSPEPANVKPYIRRRMG